VDGRYVHTNHYLDEGLLRSGLTTPPGAHSQSRQARAAELVGGLQPGVSVTDLSHILSDHQGENRICRHIEPEVEWASLAAAIMCPATREMWVWNGTPCRGEVVCHTV
jgi:hypothetical protein